MASADMAASRRLMATLASIAVIAAACASADVGEQATTEPQAIFEVSIPNAGDSTEGHTPIGFAGMGTGLFVGDNLNSRFPDGDGVQAFLTFPLPEGVSASIATLRSDVLQIRGTPFDDLGVLRVERVEYTDFGPQLFDLPSSGGPSPCRVIGGTSLTCDVTAAVQSAVKNAASSIQFRLRFERVADNDGQADLAMFYRSDSNTNETGLFVLQIASGG